jgi:hypothetical protein
MVFRTSLGQGLTAIAFQQRLELNEARISFGPAICRSVDFINGQDVRRPNQAGSLTSNVNATS